ncbi:transporter substrate-binding domain-containing protein [Arthrobacter psychrolactophilus]
MSKLVDRRPFLGAVVVSAALALTSCSGGTGLSGDLAGAGASPASEAIFKNAPVAAADLIIPGSTMEAIKKRGKLIVATALDAPLVSQQDPLNPENVTGMDADFAKLLAIYILGKPDVQWCPSAAETREAMLANGTVDVVMSTYTITPKRAQQISFAGPIFHVGPGRCRQERQHDNQGYRRLSQQECHRPNRFPGCHPDAGEAADCHINPVRDHTARDTGPCAGSR